jgi:hypothetical protein
MVKVGSDDPGVMGGAVDLSRDTSVEPPSSLVDEALARRHVADARGRRATQRNRARRVVGGALPQDAKPPVVVAGPRRSPRPSPLAVLRSSEGTASK